MEQFAWQCQDQWHCQGLANNFISFGKPLAKLKITPNILTIFGLFFGVLLYLNALSNWAVILLILSLICDGIDGSLAIITGKGSKWGAMLDSVVDRVTEFFWALTFIAIGANQYVVIAALLIASVQELSLIHI